MKRVLFVCSQNLMRSPTAERVFDELPDVETMSAGTNVTAVTPVSAELLEWADLVVAMENEHRELLAARYPRALEDKHVFVLDIPDRFPYMDSELVALLKAEVSRRVPLPGLN